MIDSSEGDASLENGYLDVSDLCLTFSPRAIATAVLKRSDSVQIILMTADHLLLLSSLQVASSSQQRTSRRRRSSVSTPAAPCSTKT